MMDATKMTHRPSPLSSFAFLGAMILTHPAIAGPRIQIDRVTIQEDLILGAARMFEFKIQNTGDEDLVILSVGKSCSCVSAEANPMRIPPGQFSKLRALYVPDAGKDSYSFVLSVISNAENEHAKVIQVGGKVRDLDFRVSPQSLILDAHPGQVQSLSLVSFVSGSKSVEILEIVENGDIYFVDGIERVDKRESRMNVKLRVPSEPGIYQESIVVKLKVGRTRATVAVPITLTVSAEISFFPLGLSSDKRRPSGDSSNG